MAQLFTLGGDRIGSGNKQKVALHNFEMNSFNLEQDFKSTLAPGVLYPFIKMIGTNHGTFDIDIDTFVRTLPTVGPLFGSFKLQLDLYSVPIRLYQGVLHNNPIDIGLNMNQVYLPKIKVRTIDYKDSDGNPAPRVTGSNDYDYQINNSALLKYMGISGLGKNVSYPSKNYVERKFNAVPILAYYDIFKNYYSNKQEDTAYVITPGDEAQESMIATGVIYNPNNGGSAQVLIPYNTQKIYIGTDVGSNIEIYLYYTTDQTEITSYIKSIIEEEQVLNFYNENEQSSDIQLKDINSETGGTISYKLNKPVTEGETRNTIEVKITIPKDSLNTIADDDVAIYFKVEDDEINLQYYKADINLRPFALKNIDKMRYALLKENELGTEFVIGDSSYWDASSGEDNTGLPYSALFNLTEQDITWNAFEQNGLVVKTYQSDLFNNWLDTEFIDGPNGIAAITAVDTTGGSFTMDTLNLAEKFYELLNRIITAGGTYQDWQDAVYGEGAVRMCETPMYIGGMAAEIMFEEVIATTENSEASQALGSLGGKGTQAKMRGGKNIHVKLDEPGYVMGIVSITPRICYSQGNDWDMTELDSMDDLHKPSLDGIGFQPLMVEQMAWWDRKQDGATLVSRNSAGKQTAWINYQTAIDKCYGDFAKQDGYAFMVLNRNYEIDPDTGGVKDVTTYIDPAKYNYAFSYADLAAQNFWVQIHSKVTARRKMGAQQLPNL